MRRQARTFGCFPQGPRRRRQEVEENLESLAGKAPESPFQNLPPQHEETAHRIGYLCFADDPRQARGEGADICTRGIQSADSAAGHLPATDHQIHRFAFQHRQHLRQQLLVVLHVGIHNADMGVRTRQCAFDAGRREPAASNPLQGSVLAGRAG
jgi:hypothetical protein